MKQASRSVERRSVARFPNLRISVFVLAFALAGGVAGAGSIEPPTFEASIDVRETIEIDKTVYVSDIAPEHALYDMVDVFFLFDNTGSTEPIIYSVKRAGREILDRIGGGDPRFQGIDVGFGVGRYLGDPGEGNSAFRSYQLQQPITKSRAAAEAAIHSWYVDGRGNFDVPEGNLFALHQVATQGARTDGFGRSDPGIASEQNTGWRPDAKRVIIWFGDAPGHESTVNLTEAITALIDNNVIVAALNTERSGRGIDYNGQASAIVSATGGTLTNRISTHGISEFILDLLAKALSSDALDLTLETRGDTSGLDIAFECVSPQGCQDVKAGESRDFKMYVTGRKVGVYEFITFAPGVNGAEEQDEISVTPGSRMFVNQEAGPAAISDEWADRIGNRTSVW